MAKISDEEIIVFLKNMLEIQVSRDYLAKPTRDFVINVYARFLEEFGFEISSLNQPDLMACCEITNIETMDVMLLPIHIFKIVQKYVEPFGLTDMNLCDILMPKRTRTHKIISALCVLYQQYINVKKDWLPIQEEGMKIGQNANELQQKVLELKHSIEEKSMLFASFNNQSVALEKEKSVLVVQNKKKKKEVDEQGEQFRLTKSEIMKLEDKQCQMEIDISKTKEKIRELEEFIIKSPNKAIQITNDLEKELDEAKIEVPIKKQEHMGILKKIDCHKAVFTSLKASTEDIRNLLIMLSETENQCQNLENINQDAMSLHEEIKSIEIETKEKQAAKQGWQSKRNNSSRQFQRNHNTLRELNNGLQQTLKKNDENIQRLQEEKLATEQILKHLEVEYDQLKETIGTLRDRYTNSISAYTTQFIKHL